ncbi:MAG TPA: hypothetical protein VGQ09_05800 [Chitinophagaceae bacterium]|jgi:hypothetical protein|nr:hypothetical protein [Chitinophagaceae bacterium]
MNNFLLSIDWSLVKVGVILFGMGVFTVIIETIVMVLFKFDRFGKSLVDSIMANIGSLLLGIFLFLVFNKTEFGVSQVFELAVLYIIISIFEAWLIKLLNAKMGWGRIIITSFVMNFLSFTSLYLIFTKFLAKFFAA